MLGLEENMDKKRSTVNEILSVREAITGGKKKRQSHMLTAESIKRKLEG
jgi:hypothetical protein